ALRPGVETQRQAGIVEVDVPATENPYPGGVDQQALRLQHAVGKRELPAGAIDGRCALGIELADERNEQVAGPEVEDVRGHASRPQLEAQRAVAMAHRLREGRGQ